MDWSPSRSTWRMLMATALATRHGMRRINAARPMIALLERDEVVHRGERLRIMRRDAHLATVWQVVLDVRDGSVLRRHHRRPGYVLHVHEAGRSKVARRERRGDLAEVTPDRRDSGGVTDGALQLDATPIW